MTREFIETQQFQKAWESLKLKDDDLKSLEEHLLSNPEVGSLMQNTGGFRKLRWALSGKGKSGGVRIIYIDYFYYKKLYLITAYPKGMKEALTKVEQNELKKLSSQLKQQLREGSD